MQDGHALVLGGGGVAGIAWMTGSARRAGRIGRDVTGADVVIGTSAGATVAAQLGSGLPLTSCYARQMDPAQAVRRADGRGRPRAKFAADLEPYLAGASTPAEQLRGFGGSRSRRTRCPRRRGSR